MGLSCWFDGHELVREVSFGIMFATPKGRPLQQFSGQVLGLQLGVPIPPRYPLQFRCQTGQSDIYRQSLPEFSLEVEVWNIDYHYRGVTFQAGRIRGIRLIRANPGPPRGAPPPGPPPVILCIFCCRPLPDGPEHCPHCRAQVGAERMEMTPQQYAQAERKPCPRCGAENLSEAIRCGHCP